MIASIKELWGCPKSKVRLHDYQWGMGPAGTSWWLYCTRCDRGIWREASGRSLREAVNRLGEGVGNAHNSSPTESVGMQIRSRHPNAFRSGEWGRIITIVPARGRDCWLIEWPGGATDLWPTSDPVADYEIR